MGITLIFRRNGERIPAHLFADCLLDNATGNLHEIALRGWAFRHGFMMPRITGDVKPCGNHTAPLPKFKLHHDPSESFAGVRVLIIYNIRAQRDALSVA
jgi:hypothetical protein